MSFSDNIHVPSAKAVITATTSAVATALLIRSIARDLLPREFQSYLRTKIKTITLCFSSQMTLTIDEFNGLHDNQLFKAAEIYLGTVTSPSTKRIRVSLPLKETNFSISTAPDELITDVFMNIRFEWRLICNTIKSSHRAPDHRFNPALTPSEARCYELIFHKKHKSLVFESYLPHVLNQSKQMREEKKTLKIFTKKNYRVHGLRGWCPWQSVNLSHPATFDTLAMDLAMKKTMMEDLDLFVKRREFYREVGKAWKRGYLLYGPPGTGKSSLIAAMANYLKFDVYDLEMSSVTSNFELRRLLVSTANRCILVVEDIDCSLESQSRAADARHAYRRRDEVNLSGLLNFIDGLWSSCGSERIIVFTTNHKDRLDPALLRPGRMDVHIEMSYITPCGFKTLAYNYLEITQHPLFPEAEKLLGMTKVTPAEVGEQLMRHDDPETALEKLIEFLREKRVMGSDSSIGLTAGNQEEENLSQ